MCVNGFSGWQNFRVIRRRVSQMSSLDTKTGVKDNSVQRASPRSGVSTNARGEFIRGVTTARKFVSDDEGAEHPVESGRYHLYVAFNCPWCHRVILGRALLGQQDVISMDVLMPVRTEEGHEQGEGKWQFKPEGLTARNGEFVQFEECTNDTVNGMGTIGEIYHACGFENVQSVPVLFDKKLNTVVSNESSEILRMLGTVFAPLRTRRMDDSPLFCEEKRREIEKTNDWIYSQVNNGAYRAGFSTNQKVYEEAYAGYFAAFERLNGILASQKWVCGDTLTEADVRLFPTIFRHDPVYFHRMKLNKHYIFTSYPHLWRWLKDFYALEGVSGVCPLNHMKQGYFGRTGNGVLPVGPEGWLERLQE